MGKECDPSKIGGEEKSKWGVGCANHSYLQLRAKLAKDAAQHEGVL